GSLPPLGLTGATAPRGSADPAAGKAPPEPPAGVPPPAPSCHPLSLARRSSIAAPFPASAARRLPTLAGASAGAHADRRLGRRADDLTLQACDPPDQGAGGLSGVVEPAPPRPPCLPGPGPPPWAHPATRGQ